MAGLPSIVIALLPEVASATRTQDKPLRWGGLKENLGASALSFGLVSLTPALIAAVIPMSVTAKAVIAGTVAWLLSEIFTRVRRLLVPSVITAALLAEMAVAGLAAAIPGIPMKGSAPDLVAMGTLTPGSLALALTASAILMVLHHRLVRAPVDLGLAACLAGAAILSAGQAIAPETMAVLAHHLVLTWAWLTLCAAFAYDLGDPNRDTRSAGTAFWLHCAANAMFLYSLIACAGPLKELSLLIGFPVFATIGILCDRMILITMTKSLLILVLVVALVTANPMLALVTGIAFACLTYATAVRTVIRRRFLERTFWQIAPQLPPLRETI